MIERDVHTSTHAVVQLGLRDGSLSVSVRAALWVLGFVVALAAASLWGAGTSVHNDFTQNVWLPSRLLLDGANPYSPTRLQVDQALGQYSGDFIGFNSGAEYHAIYPVWMFAAFTPFGALPLVAATALWRALNLVLLVWSLGSLLRASNPAFRVVSLATGAALFITCLLALIYRESILTLYLGQFSFLELGVLAAIWGWLIRSDGVSRQKRLAGDILTGVGLAMLATKPQSVGLAVVLIGVWALCRKRYTIPVAAVAALTVLLLAPLVAFPWSLGDWLGVVVGGQAGSQAEVSASIWGVSYQVLGATGLWRPVALIASLLVLAFAVPRWLRDLRDTTSPVPLSLGLTLCLNSVVSPYLLGYEHVVLLFPAMLFLAVAGLTGGTVKAEAEKDARLAQSRKMWRLAIYIWVAVLPFLVVALQSVLDGKEYLVIAQSLPMLALCWIFPFVWERYGIKHESNNNLQSLPYVGGKKAL